MSERAIAVVGMACRFPDAPDTATLWNNILARHTSFRDVPRERWDHRLFLTHSRDANGTNSRKAAMLREVGHFAATHFNISSRRAEAIDPQQRLTLEVVREALIDAGLEMRPFDRRRTATFVGAGVSEYSRIMVMPSRGRQLAAGEFGVGAEEAARSTSRVIPCRAYTVSGSLLSMCASTVAQTFDLRGPSMAVDAACASSLMAIIQGVHYLRGLPPRADATEPAPVALAGGVYLCLLPDNFPGFSRIGALAQEACRPFDARADGFIIGEGVGIVALKRLSDALRDKDRVYVVIRGVASNSDGRSASPMTPVLEGQVELMGAGLRDASANAADVGYVECHGTGTLVGDAVELEALSQVFGPERRPRLGSIKANIGHTLSASGVAGFIRAALAVYHGVLPPQAGWDRWAEALQHYDGRFDIDTTPSPWGDKPRLAMVNSYGFGGTNAFALLEQAPQADLGPWDDNRWLLFVCSAPNASLLSDHLAQLAPCIGTLARPALDAAAWTLARTRSVMSYVSLFAARTTAEAKQHMESLQGRLQHPPTRLTCVAPGELLGPSGEAADGELPPPTGEVSYDRLLAAGVAHVRGQAVDWDTLLPVHHVRDLPVPPLERARFWAVAPP